MPDDYYTSSSSSSSTPPPPPRGSSLRAVLGAVLVAFLGGAALVGYLVWDGRIHFRKTIETTTAQGDSKFAASPSPSASSPANPPPTSAASPATPLALPGPVDQRVAALEQRLNRLDLQAAAAEGNAARAEGLLIATAARRAIERGAPLGYLADQLKLRFSAAQPAAVDTIIAAAAHPVTLDQLTGQLDALSPTLAAAPASEGGWQRLRRELSGLFVVRHDDTPSTSPQNRLERARMMLRTGQYDAAADEVSHMPGSATATQWIANARRYAGVQRSLDLIETTALLDPDKVRTGTGQSVAQPSPAGPSPSPATVDDPTI